MAPSHRPHSPNYHSSAESGFFQQPPRLENQFLSDTSLQRVLSLYVPASHRGSLFNDLATLGDKVISRQVLSWVEDAERHPPELDQHDAFAQRHDVLRTSEGWRRLQEMGQREGCVAEGYGGPLGRLGQFSRYYIFSPSAALVTCPFAMTDGAARLLARTLSRRPSAPPSLTATPELPIYTTQQHEADSAREVFKSAYHHLTSRDPTHAWTSGQWMTERPGGSDVSRTETLATYSPAASASVGPWVVNGYKFFSSATDAQMSILLARTPGRDTLSAFYAPMTLPDGSPNGVRIVRLKRKLGTRPLPTAELELRGMRAWLLGAEGEGIREVSTILNITRIHTSVSAVSFMSRALNVAKAYSRVRVVAKGSPLHKNPLHLRTLARLELLTRAAVHLAFLNVHMLSLSESASSTPPCTLRASPAAASTLLRLLTSLSKAVTAKLAIVVISECIESLGGIGYLENEEPLNLARLWRDAQVLSIWEGTTNVLVTEFVRAIKKEARIEDESPLNVLGEWIRENLAATSGAVDRVLEEAKVGIWEEWKSVKEVVEKGTSVELTAAGRRVMWRIAYVVAGVCLLVDARRDRNRWAVEMVGRWVRQGFEGHGEENEWVVDEGVVFGGEKEVRPKL